MGQVTYQLNPLIEAQKTFSAMETRLFYLGLQDINPHISDKDKYYDEQFPDTIITPSELTKIFGHTQYLTEIDKATDNLIGRYIAIRYEDGFEKYTIFQHIKYKSEKGLFIKFNEDMRPFILDIYKSYKKYGFTKIEMQQIFYLGSAYAMRILELLLQYKSTAKDGIIVRNIEIEELRKKLNVPEEAYKGKINNFKQFVLNKPIENINKNTKYNVRYEIVKTGRKVSGFVFYCNCNKEIKDDEYTETIESQSYEKKLEQEAGQMQLLESPPAQTQQGLTADQQEAYDSLINRSVSPQKADELAKKYELKRIKSNLEIAVKQKETSRNLPGLIISLIEQDAAGKMEIEKQEARERIEQRQLDRRQAYDDFHGTTLIKIGKVEEMDESKEENIELNELTEIEVELIKAGKPNGFVRGRMDRLGLTVEDVKAGRRK